jgi:hypothetical protein
MSLAKLRRSRNVLELDPIKIEIARQIRDLEAQAQPFAVRRGGYEYVHQVADLITKSQLTCRSASTQSLYIFSGEHCTALSLRERSAP